MGLTGDGPAKVTDAAVEPKNKAQHSGLDLEQLTVLRVTPK